MVAVPLLAAQSGEESETSVPVLQGPDLPSPLFSYPPNDALNEAAIEDKPSREIEGRYAAYALPFLCIRGTLKNYEIMLMYAIYDNKSIMITTS